MDKSFTPKYLGQLGINQICAMDMVKTKNVSYIVMADEKKVNFLKITLDKTILTRSEDKLKVQKIIANQKNGVVYILANGEVSVFSVPEMTLKCTLGLKEVKDIAINASDKTETTKLLVIYKKKKVKQYNYEDIQSKFNEIAFDKDLQLNETPEKIEWYEKLLCYIYREKIIWLNFNSGKFSNTDLPNVVTIKYVQKSLIASTKELGLFLQEGSVKPISPISFSQEGKVGKFLDLGEIKNYIIAFHLKAANVYLWDGNNYQCIQTIYHASGEESMYILSGLEKIVYTTNENLNQIKFYQLQEKPYEEMKNDLLKKGKIEEALSKLNENVDSSESEKPEKIEEFFLDCAWASLNESFERAAIYCKITNFNPFEFIYMFYSRLTLEIVHKKEVEEKIKRGIPENQIEKIVTNDDKKLKEALKFLITILIAKRNYICSKFKFPKDENLHLTYSSSKLAIIDLSSYQNKVDLKTTLNYINMSIIRAMIENKQSPKEIGAIIDHPSFVCKGNENFFNELSKKDQKPEFKIAQAYYFEKILDYDKALKIWEDFGRDVNKKVGALISKEARERTKQIFLKMKNSKDSIDRNEQINLYKKYIKWLIEESPNDSFDVQIETELVPMDYFINTILKDEMKGKQQSIEKFLTYYNEKCPNEEYQTLLICTLIDRLYESCSRDTPLSQPGTPENSPEYQTLMKYLKAKGSCYEKKEVLKKVEGSWIIEAQIFLYSELNKHEDALRTLLEKACTTSEKDYNFKEVEEYCENNYNKKEEIFNIFFEMITEKYSAAEKLNKESQAKVFENEMMNLLQKYSSVTKLDPVKVIQKIPGHLNICDEGLYKYITSAIKEYTSLTNKYKVERNISDMALIYKEKEVYTSKNKFVTIENETNCELCKKRIGNTIFVVYPNMKIYHSKCASNPSVCPTTGIDFTKKKLFN